MRFVLRVVTGILVFSAFCFFMQGCNTMKGLGRDIEHGGKKIQEASGK